MLSLILANEVLTRSKKIVFFPTPTATYMFSRASRQVHVFPRFLLGACWLALSADSMFSRAYITLYVFPRLLPVACSSYRLIIYIYSATVISAHIGSGQIMGWGEKAIEVRSVETGLLDSVFMHKRAQTFRFLCERNEKVSICTYH